MGILDRKASRNHDNHKFFSTAQRGGRKGSGTEDALLVFSAQLEEAFRLKTNICGTSWDNAKAFDSVSKKAIRVGDRSSGVSVGFTDWAIDMDETGELIVRSAVAEVMMEAQGYNGFSTNGRTGTLPSFCAKSGVGQGDVSSPNYWKKVYDILLRAIEIADTPGKLCIGESDTLYTTETNAFVDDMTSVTATGPALQRIADIVSGFSAIFGMKLATTKLRPDYTLDTLIIHLGTTWTAVEVPVMHVGSIKYLGVKFDIDRSGNFYKTMYKLLVQKARSVCTILGARKASAATKIMVAQLSTMASIKYGGLIGN